MEKSSEINVPEKLVIQLREHESLKCTDYIKSLNISFKDTAYEGEPKYMGITPDMVASYYIGVDWLKIGEKAVAVLPKMDDVDYNEMLIDALEFSPSSEYFSKFYGINFEKPFIKTDCLNGKLTSLVIVHYLYVIKQLLSIGLRHSYIEQTENLKSKMKGKILMGQHIMTNIIPKREERVMCLYQDYSVDTPENRLLKKALIFSKRALETKQLKNLDKLTNGIKKALVSFNNVSDEISLYEVKHISRNKIYKYYGEAIRLAKLILRRYDYAIDKIENQENTPPFWIDMSRLYEVYVYTKLYKVYNNTIKFQVPGHCRTAADFIKTDENLVIDTKYKPRFNFGNKRIIDDIREISGYARDQKILKYFEGRGKGQSPNCLIIYPFVSPDSEEEDRNQEDGIIIKNKCFDGSKPLCCENNVIKGFEGFYKLAIELPKKNKKQAE